MLDKVRGFLAKRAVKKIVRLINKYEDYLLLFVNSEELRKIIDLFTDMLEVEGKDG